MRRQGRLPDWVVWDWNGTLLDDLRAGFHAVNSLLAERGLPLLTLPRYRETFTFPVSDFYRSAGIDPDREDWPLLARHYHHRVLASPHTRLHPHAPPAIAAIARRGIRQCVLSALEQTLLTQGIAAAGLSHTFEHTLGSDNLHGAGKTHLARRLARIAGIEPRHTTLMIGDTLHDAQVAAEMGWHCILVARGHQSEPRLRTAQVPVIPDLAELTREFETRKTHA